MLHSIQRCCCKDDCPRVVVNPSGRGRVIAPECAARLRKREPQREARNLPDLQPPPDREPPARSAVPELRPSLPPERPAGPPALPADGPGRWALIPAHDGYCLNDATGEGRTAWHVTSEGGRPNGYHLVGPWRTMVPNLKAREPRLRLKGAGSGAGVPVRELVERTFGPDAPYLQRAQGVAS